MNKENEIRFPLTAPLNEFDTEKQTYGCRHSNPEICNSCYIEKICAFTSSDHICKKPSKSWVKFYQKLLIKGKND